MMILTFSLGMRRGVPGVGLRRRGNLKGGEGRVRSRVSFVKEVWRLGSDWREVVIVAAPPDKGAVSVWETPLEKQRRSRGF